MQLAIIMSTMPAVFVPEPIEQHIKNSRNLLKSQSSVRIEQLIPSHVAMDSILHEGASEKNIDTSAFIYSLLRLPQNMSEIKQVILGQSYTVFKNNGLTQIDLWQKVEAPGRRRKMYFDGNDNLGVYIGSVSDVDDLVTLLTAFQIEWNKLHSLFSNTKHTDLEQILTQDDIVRFQTILGENYKSFFQKVAQRTIDITLTLLSGSYVEYMRSTQYWWNHVADSIKDLQVNKRPIYFVSSNMHSLSNVITKTAVNHQEEIISYLHSNGQEQLLAIWQDICSGKSKDNAEFFLHYAAKKFARNNPDYFTEHMADEVKFGIQTIMAHHYLDINVQIIEVAKLSQGTFHESLKLDLKPLAKSNAIIVNIDYPLGWAAYQILTEIGQNVDILRGVYLMGKAAILTGKIGDITLPSTVFDLHTKNTYQFTNVITSKELKAIFRSGNVTDEQKALTVKGTFFENRQFINHWYNQGFSTIEMEAGPYLNAMYECVSYNRYLENESINLSNPPFEIGIAHYASDTPNSKAKNLGARNLSYEGVESTYGISLVILKKILEHELSFVL